MAVVYNVRAKAIVDKDGNIQRQKYKSASPVSLAYGLYLGEDSQGDVIKAFFLLTSFVPGSGEIASPSEIRNSPRYKSVSLEEFPFSKKFSISEDLLSCLTPSQEYWFLYTSEAVSNTINGKLVTYESLDLICLPDLPGPDGIKSLIPLLKLKLNQQNS